MCDATYKMNDMRMPLYIVLGLDGNGHSQVVALYLTTTEMAAALSRMLVTFQNIVLQIFSSMIYVIPVSV